MYQRFEAMANGLDLRKNAPHSCLSHTNGQQHRLSIKQNVIQPFNSLWVHIPITHYPRPLLQRLFDDFPGSCGEHAIRPLASVQVHGTQ